MRRSHPVRPAGAAPGPRLVLPALLALLAAPVALLPLGGCSDSTDPGDGDGAPGPFRSAASCGVCHPQHFAEWVSSMHAFGGVDPVMIAAAELARAELGQAAGDACHDCHSPSLKRQRDWLASLPPTVDPLVEDVSLDGISCDVCHSIDLIPPAGDISFLADVDPSGPKLGGIRDPIPNEAHESKHDDSFQTSVQCRSCHQIFLENGVGVENTFREWLDSNGAGMGQECQTCHMPGYTGQAAIGGPADRTVHHHTFIGVDFATVPYRGVDRDRQIAAVDSLLRNSVTVSPDVPASAAAGSPLTLRFPVRNDKVGHSIPSGTSFAREMWIRLSVRDARDSLVHRSGWLEGADSTLVDVATDPSLVSFGSHLLDAQGDRTFFLWRAVDIDESRLLPSGAVRDADYTFDVPVDAVGPLTVDVALRFRAFAPEQLLELGLTDLLPVHVFDMWTPPAPYVIPLR